MLENRFLFAIFTLIFSALASFTNLALANTQDAQWNCDFRAELNGVPSSFLYHNKDSWEGHGQLQCIRNLEIFDEQVTIQYEGWASATGLAGKSRLLVFSYFIPAGHPQEILNSFPTASLGDVPSYYNLPVTTVLHVGRNRPFEMAVQASQLDDNLRVPLNFGTLSIRKKIDR